MHCIRPIISNQRLQRFHRWALLWLTWFAAVIEYGAAFAPLSRQAKALAHEYLDQIERLIVAIVIIRAGAAIPHGAAKPWRAHALKCKQTGFRRAVLGVKLWRALRQRDLSQRIAALRQDISAMTARVTRRLPRGLTRRRPIRARPEVHIADLREAILAPAPGADTS